MAKQFEIVVEGRAREVYVVEAESEEEARQMWDTCNVPSSPSMTEVFDTEVIEVVDTGEEV